MRPIFQQATAFPAAEHTGKEAHPSSTFPHGAYVNPDKLAAHLLVDRYGDFLLTDAVRPSLDLQVVPREGFRIETYRDDQADLEVPVLAAAVSREKLFDVFLALLEPLGEVVDVVLETSH